MKYYIGQCLNDLNINSTIEKDNMLNMMNLTQKRTNDYLRIDKMLENDGVEDADRKVTLDGHNFTCSLGKCMENMCYGTGNFHEILHMLNIICCWCEENDVEVYTMMISDGKILNSDRLGDGKYLLKTHGRIFAIEKSY